MPLIVPGINNNSGGNSTNSWMEKLMGKKLGESSDTTNFAKKELPQNHRVVPAEGGMMTMDHNPDRSVARHRLEEDKSN